MIDKYVRTLILVVQRRPKPMIMHLALRLIHTACRYTQELKARIGGEFGLTKVRLGCTVKILEIRTPGKFAFITLKFSQDGSAIE